MDVVQRLQEASSSIRLETMFLCVPLRLGVLLIATITFFLSLLYVCDRPYWEAVYRPFTGGFCLRSQIMIGAVEFTGVLFGMLGMMGAWYVKKSYVAWFNYWQIARLAAWAFMYMVDVPLLRTCEFWVNDIQTMTQEHGWNQLMYSIALDANCESTRKKFFILSVLILLLFAYIVWCTSKYVEFIGAVPKHLLRVDKDMPPGAFYAHGHGERTALTGASATMGPRPSGVYFEPKGMANMMATGGGLTPGAALGHAHGEMIGMSGMAVPGYGAGGSLTGPATNSPRV